MDSTTNPGMSDGAVLFTGDDYQLVVDAMYREEDRRELFERYNGIAAPADDQLERLGDLARRIGLYLNLHQPRANEPGTAT